MSEPFLGEIKMFGGNFAPRGYAKCDGQLIAISQNSALFSLLGTMYGGDGRETFGLPDLRGRFPMGVGNGPGLTDREYGEQGGSEIEIVAGKPPIIGWGSTNEIGKNKTDGEALSPGPYMPPYQAIQFIIAIQGVFPSRN